MNPGGLEEPLARERPLRSFQKRNKQPVFALRQRHSNSIRAYQAAVVAFELPAAELVSTPLWLARSRESAQFVPPQDGSNAREQLSQAERLGHVVVRTEFEADHAIDFLQPVPGSDDHGNVGVGSNLSEQIQPIFAPQSQIENDQARLAPGEMTSQVLAAGRGTGRHVVFLEVIRDHPPGGRVIIDYEYVVGSAAVVGLQSIIQQ
jgi:hypothetical protein